MCHFFKQWANLSGKIFQLKSPHCFNHYTDLLKKIWSLKVSVSAFTLPIETSRSPKNNFPILQKHNNVKHMDIKHFELKWSICLVLLLSILSVTIWALMGVICSKSMPSFMNKHEVKGVLWSGRLGLPEWSLRWIPLGSSPGQQDRASLPAK